VTADRRFRDPHTHLESLTGTVLVVCPSCEGRALVLPDPAQRVEQPRGPGDVTSPARRLVCEHCGAVRTEGRRRSLLLGAPVDPWFRRPVWLQAECCGHTLWAYNVEHLALLKEYVAADLREDSGGPGQSMLGRLPAWIKLAGNRRAVLRALADLRSRAG
jgi:hypothetical protein